MSLINEALKKAQSERPGSEPGQENRMHSPGPPQHPPARRRNFLWGFFLSVLIVGTFSAAVSTFLVFKILGDENEPTPARTEAGPARESAPAADTQPAPAPSTEADLAEQASAPAEEPPAPVAKGSEAAAANTDSLPQKTLPSTPETIPPAPDPEPPVQAGGPPTVPNAASWARLDQLEIRGMMSGGTKVLIYDSSTGRTRSFVEGDLIDGQLGLRLTSIGSNAIVFEDYGGNKLTKPF